MDKSHLLPNNPARQKYRYTSVPIEAANHVTTISLRVFIYKDDLAYRSSGRKESERGPRPVICAPSSRVMRLGARYFFRWMCCVAIASLHSSEKRAENIGLFVF
jgi:hypothetical protein